MVKKVPLLVCVDCKTPLADAGAIGLYCPNKECKEPSSPKLEYVSPLAEIVETVRRMGEKDFANFKKAIAFRDKLRRADEDQVSPKPGRGKRKDHRGV